MHWTTSQQSKVSPSLFYNRQFISNYEKRADIQRDSLLARYQASDDLSRLLPGESQISWRDELEVRNCTIESGNTCPGSGRISVQFLTACWESI